MVLPRETFPNTSEWAESNGMRVMGLSDFIDSLYTAPFGSPAYRDGRVLAAIAGVRVCAKGLAAVYGYRDWEPPR